MWRYRGARRRHLMVQWFTGSRGIHIQIFVAYQLTNATGKHGLDTFRNPCRPPIMERRSDALDVTSPVTRVPRRRRVERSRVLKLLEEDPQRPQRFNSRWSAITPIRWAGEHF